MSENIFNLRLSAEESQMKLTLRKAKASRVDSKRTVSETISLLVLWARFLRELQECKSTILGSQRHGSDDKSFKMVAQRRRA
jgi:hypothetical protein